MPRSRFTLQALLSGRAHDYAHLARPLLHSLERMHHFEIEVAGDFSALNEGRARVLLAASDEPLDGDQAAQLNEFVRRGGGVVLLHGTLAGWSENDAIAEMAGWRLGRPGPLTELVVRVADHPVTARLSPEIRIEDELYLSEGPPAEANVLLRASWRFSDQVVAYERQHGDGRFVQIGLGHGAAIYQDPDFQKLVHRAVLFASGAPPAPTVGVGLIGYGAIARGHAESISATPGLDMRAVAEISPERRELASRELGVTSYSSAEEMLRDPDVGLVVVGTPPSVHADPVVAAIQAGKHVVCEKPFAITVDEVDRMIDAAAAHRRVLTVYQSRRWDPDYLAMRETIRSGRIGERFYMESFIGGGFRPLAFLSHHAPPSRGAPSDWGAPYFDFVLQLFVGLRRPPAAARPKRGLCYA